MLRQAGGVAGGTQDGLVLSHTWEGPGRRQQLGWSAREVI